MVGSKRSKKILECIKEGDGGVYVDLKISPNSSETKIDGVNPWRNRIHVSVTEEAKDGKANEMLIDHLSNILEIDASGIKITKGAKSDRKRIFLKGHDKERIAKRVSSILNVE